MQTGAVFGFPLLGRLVPTCCLFLLFVSTGRAQTDLGLDDSDWWSLGRIFSAPLANVQQGELASSNFEILSIVLGDKQYKQARAKLGRTTDVSRGDAAIGRGQLCCSSVGAAPQVYLIF